MASTPAANESDVLRRVRIRRLLDAGRPPFDRLLTEQHYLHDPIRTGQSLRYVAELDGQWVALITFSAAARGQTKVDTLKSWCQQQTFTTAWPPLRR
jgi:hypothetical protein